MITYKFRTNITCGNCVKAVTPFLDELEKVSQWQVDTADTDRTLTVVSRAENPDEIMHAVAKAGYKAEPLT